MVIIIFSTNQRLPNTSNRSPSYTGFQLARAAPRRSSLRFPLYPNYENDFCRQPLRCRRWPLQCREAAQPQSRNSDVARQQVPGSGVRRRRGYRNGLSRLPRAQHRTSDQVEGSNALRPPHSIRVNGIVSIRHNAARCVHGRTIIHQSAMPCHSARQYSTVPWDASVARRYADGSSAAMANSGDAFGAKRRRDGPRI